MKSTFHRRGFLKRASLGAGALAAAGLFPAPGILRAATTRNKLNTVLIGCGGRGLEAHLGHAAAENLVALVDADENCLAAANKALVELGGDAAKVRTFTDYRRMFDQIPGQIDVVFIATPNHHHALPTMIAMQLGKGVYCEKPLCHDIAETRRVAEMARKCKVPTQMGNQGHCGEEYRRLCEYIWAGAIGKIAETHSWTDRSNGGTGPRPPREKPWAGMHWDEWIGPAPYRDFHGDLHPHEWHGWFDFGNGSLGNMACHVLEGVFWALKVEHPLVIEVEEMAGGSNERYPTATRIRWDIPARGDLPALKAYWYDGHELANGKPNIVPLLAELKKKFPHEKRFQPNGTLYVGEKGVLCTGMYGWELFTVPADKIRETEFTSAPHVLPRFDPQDPFHDFLWACREGKTDTATSFDYAARLTEFTLLGNLAQHAGPGKKVAWDGPNMKVTNLPELDHWLKREYRKGWEI